MFLCHTCRSFISLANGRSENGRFKAFSVTCTESSVCVFIPHLFDETVYYRLVLIMSYRARFYSQIIFLAHNVLLIICYKLSWCYRVRLYGQGICISVHLLVFQSSTLFIMEECFKDVFTPLLTSNGFDYHAPCSPTVSLNSISSIVSLISVCCLQNIFADGHLLQH